MYTFILALTLLVIPTTSFAQCGNVFSDDSPCNMFGHGQSLHDSQGNYRGQASNNPFDSNSTSNPFGRYGNPLSPDSLNNPFQQPAQVLPPQQELDYHGHSSPFPSHPVNPRYK